MKRKSVDRKISKKEDNDIKKRKTSIETKKKYNNDETFAYGTPVNDIPNERLLVLDNYAFDIDELNQLPEKDLFTNMHTQSEFSEEAKQILASNSILGEKVQKLLPQTVLPESLMKNVYDLAITLLTYGDSKESEDAVSNFQLKLDSMHPKDKEPLLNFIIKMNMYNQRAQAYIMSKMTFGEVYSQLVRGDFCVRAAGNWFVQAVRMTYPAMVNEEHVRNLNTIATQKAQQARSFPFFAQNRVQVTHPPEIMHQELNEMMRKNQENQEKLIDFVNTL
ncbi:hypothetical protein [Legionella gresilensis]|uniref:hypothetical protein n=1 Tax=Legionella gresilensis TaxID=91823 RepID=UPI0010414203|nr:hypothetical protein [Legionella gresilensis]